MKTIVETAMTCAVASVLTTALMAQVVEVSLAPFQTINERMAEASGRPKPPAREHPSLQTLFADFDWWSKGGASAMAVRFSRRFTLIMTTLADE